MSFFKRKASSTRRFLNLKDLTDFSIDGYNNHHLIYYSLSPYNLSVLSKENIQAKIFDLMNLIKGIEVLEFLCLNGRENFRFNKINMRKRIEKSFESHGFTIRKLSKDDLKTMLAVYYEQNVTTDKFEDIDGKRWNYQ